MITYLIGFVLTMLGIGTIAIKILKGTTAEALLKNQQTKEQIDQIQVGISKDEGLLAAEKEKRDQAEADLKAKESKDVTKDELLDFINNNDPNKSSH